MNGPTDIRLRSLPSAVTLKGMSDVSQLLNALEQGDPHAANQLLPLVYNELRRLAGRYMRDERPGHTLQPTALVHEMYARLAGAKPRPRSATGSIFSAWRRR